MSEMTPDAVRVLEAAVAVAKANRCVSSQTAEAWRTVDFEESVKRWRVAWAELMAAVDAYEAAA